MQRGIKAHNVAVHRHGQATLLAHNGQRLNLFVLDNMIAAPGSEDHLKRQADGIS
jgi:hypothetical protein